MNIFELLKKARPAEVAASPLPQISLWRRGVCYLIFFTLNPDLFSSHYDEEGKTSYLCLGEGCPACAAGVKATEHLYLPVWDAQNRRVAVLKFHTGENGPAPKLLEFLATYRNQLADIVAVIECAGKGQFTITPHQPLPETDRGALACEAFAKGLESGAIKLRTCVRQLTSDQIATLPGVKGRAKAVVGPPVAPLAMAPTSVDDPVVGPAVPPITVKKEV